MIYRNYGQTGKKVSLLGFGGMRFKDKKNAVAALQKGVELGINYFDTAPLYGNSEDIFGEAFAPFKKEINDGKLYFSTKSMYYQEKTAAEVEKICNRSLQRMQMEKIHFFHMWSIRSMDQFRKIMAPGGAYEGAKRLKKAGKIDHIVFSCHFNNEEIKQVINEDVFEGVLLGYNLLNYKRREKGITAARQHHIGIAVMNPLAGGVIPGLAQNWQQMGGSASRLGQDPGRIIRAALQFVALTPGVSTVLSGMSDPDMVSQNAAALDNLDELDIEEIKKIAPDFNMNGRRFCTQCGYCLDSCPQKINIPSMFMWLDMHHAGLKQQAQTWWNIFSGENEDFQGTLPSDCTECGSCEEVCTQHLDIINRLKECEDIFL